jgi:hypothetical protein
MRTFRSISLLLLLLAAAGLLAAGCGDDDKAAEKTVKKATGADVDIDSDKGKVSVTDEDGNTQTMTSGEELPKGFPKEISLPDGAKVTNGTKVSSGDGDTFVISATTDKSFDEVMKFYKDELDGYKQELDISTDDGASAQYRNDEWNVLIGVARQGDDNVISMTVTPGSK